MDELLNFLGLVIAELLNRWPRRERPSRDESIASFRAFLFALVLTVVIHALVYFVIERSSETEGIGFVVIGVFIFSLPASYLILYSLAFHKFQDFAAQRKMSQQKAQIRHEFETARRLIGERRYGEARAILARIRHPKAREWEAGLNRIAPPEPDFLRQLE